MKRPGKRTAAWLAAGSGALLLAGVVAPYVSAQRFGEGIRAGLGRALGRRVDIGAAHFELFRGPGFTIDDVVIHEDPSVGIEPIAYVGSLEAVPRLSALLRGRLEFVSIRLDEASITLTKTGAAAAPGRWNFEPLVGPGLIASFPEIHVRSSRINFKFGETKSVFYLTDTDLDISPPSRWSRDWSVNFSGAPARTDRAAHGFGRFAASGRWRPGPTGGRLNLELELAKSNIGEMITLVHGQNAGIHGTIAARLLFSGPLNDVKIAGHLEIDDVHRWDLLPPRGSGWPLNLEGRLDAPGQKLELVSSSTGGEVLPLTFRFRASDYLSRPRWGFAVNWNRFPIAPLMELARHMGANLPARLRMSGTLDGAIGYEPASGFQGELAFHDTALEVPDSPPVRFEQAQLLFDRGHVRLSPAVVRTPDDEQALLEADYSLATEALGLQISTRAMRVSALRSQVALAAVPWLEQVRSGAWYGQLRYQHCGNDAPSCPQSGWTGRITLENAEVPIAGLKDPLKVAAASARIHGAHLVIDRMEGEVGGIPFKGDYRYEPQFPHPHRLRLILQEVDAAQLERQLAPTLNRSGGLLARVLSFRRTSLPGWLRTRRIEGTLQIGVLKLAAQRFENIRARLTWDVTRLDLSDLQAHLEAGNLVGRLSVNLRGAEPAYQLSARLKGLQWKSGTVDADAAIHTSGTGHELLANLRCEGNFEGRLLEWEELPAFKSVSGAYLLEWSPTGPKLSLSDLQLSTGGEVYTGHGSTLGDGNLLILLSSGSKEMRMTGTLASLRVDESAPAR